MFGLDGGGKGEFPFLLNRAPWIPADFGNVAFEEMDKDGTIHYFPPLKYFQPDGRKPADAEELRIWHAEQVLLYNKANRWYAAQELLKYCRSDVR